MSSSTYLCNLGFLHAFNAVLWNWQLIFQYSSNGLGRAGRAEACGDRFVLLSFPPLSPLELPQSFHRPNTTITPPLPRSICIGKGEEEMSKKETAKKGGERVDAQWERYFRPAGLFSIKSWSKLLFPITESTFSKKKNLQSHVCLHSGFIIFFGNGRTFLPFHVLT